ncbi:DUF1636 domain-containing protein [Paracoccus sp. (in: a-proteobacteria)]|uniref:DUF1636 domain-containing protein n=1 Tax=Paracoccus sp. TaxID=267 RepID=UPI0026DF9CE1|nr:DUF1636 domain-containing protein [Paracoccus sp. (in: a-proteobacteria)]MDO5648589.1 DUF1636 domain-containing protein [Paracoccus sp. (in: a-proteobacteria)]
MTEILICTTCRLGAPDPDAPRAGAVLAERLAGALPPEVTLRPVECLSNCTRGCTIVLQGGPDRWTYIYGNLDPDQHIDAVIAGTVAYAATTDGLVPWRDRPDHFRKNCIARIPPQMPKQEG